MDLTLTAPGYGMGLRSPWSRDMMTEEAQLALGIF